MSEEVDQNFDQMKENEEEIIIAPTPTSISPTLMESNKEPLTTSVGDCSGVNESPDKQQDLKNNSEPATNESPEQIAECPDITGDMVQNPLETTSITVSSSEQTVDVSPVRVKEEPAGEEIDYGMPIAKTPRESDPSQSDHNMVTDTPFETTAIVKTETYTGNSMNSNETDKANLDAYLDGIKTTIAPLRVKPEFALPKTPQRRVSNEDDLSNSETNIEPPPPPTFSSLSNIDLADGIATPRLSLASINRIRVKPEFSVPVLSTPQHSNDNSFNDRLIHESKEDGEASPSISDETSDDEPIPADFFDDLLHDKLKEKVEEAQSHDLEEKYSYRLKEMERLQNEKKRKQEKSKKHKKQKKSKKKSRKRSRTRSPSPRIKTTERNFHDKTGLSNYNKTKRSRMSSRDEMASTSRNAHIRSPNQTCKREHLGLNIKSEFPEYTSESQVYENMEEMEEVLTPKQKRERAIKRATALYNYLKKSSDDKTSKFSGFPFVSTVRKLPTSNSYVQQQIYENRSPLHTVNNVNYKFNSLATRFNMEEWGLAALSPLTAKMAKLVGCDAQFIHNKLKTIKIPAKLKKIKQESNNDTVNEEEEELIETTSTLYSNAMTQTDDVNSESDITRKPKGHDVGVQAVPTLYSIGSQTVETQLPTENVQKDKEAPLMKVMSDLNENQLMAVHAFAEFIKEPKPNGSAMEMYKIQMEILDIYKMSQIPSALLSAQNPIVNNYTTNMIANTRNPAQISIKSVVGGDGKQFSINDPRSKSSSHANYDSRHLSYSQSFHGNTTETKGRNSSDSSHSPSSLQWPNTTYSNQAPPTTTKNYGRGGLRR